MTRETKVGLLVGMGVILLIGIIVSDHLSMAKKAPAADVSDYAPLAQNSLNAAGTGMQPLPASSNATTINPPVAPLPTPDQLQAPTPMFTPAADPTSTYATGPAPTSPVMPDPQAIPAAIGRGMEDSLASVDNTARPTVGDVVMARSVEVPTRVTPGPQPSFHYVQSGETLYSIAARYYNNGELWPVLSKANPGVVKADNSVGLGARLMIPNKALLPELLRSMPQAADVLSPVGTAAIPTQSPRTAAAITVQPGDTLSALASKHLGTSRRWEELLKANRDVLDKAEDLRVGMVLKLPAGSTTTAAAPAPSAAATTTTNNAAKVHTVASGDTLYQIAQKHMGDGNKWRQLFDANRDQLKKPDDLKVGMKINIPPTR